MNHKSILFKIKSFFVVLIFLTFTNFSLAKAGSANPPKVQSIKMLNPEKMYKAGDVVTFSIKYSGGNPGLKRVDLWAQNQVQGKGIGDYCLIGDPWFLFWGDKPSNYGLPIGPISTSEVLMYKYVSANCVKGINEVRLTARLADLTDLASDISLSRSSLLTTLISFLKTKSLMVDRYNVPLPDVNEQVPGFLNSITVDHSTIG